MNVMSNEHEISYISEISMKMTSISQSQYEREGEELKEILKIDCD